MTTSAEDFAEPPPGTRRVNDSGRPHGAPPDTVSAVVALATAAGVVAGSILRVVTERVVQIAAAAATRVVEEVLDRLDLTELVVERVDLDRVADRVNVERIVDRIDVDAIVARVDLDAAIERVDIAAVARSVLEELDLAGIIRESSGTMAAETIEGLRLQGMNADQFVARVMDRVLGRRGRPMSGSPPDPTAAGSGI